MKKIFFILLFCLVFSVSASAATYETQFDLSGAEQLESSLPDTAADMLSQLNIDPADSEWVNKINTGNIFTIIGEFISSGGRAPLSSAVAILGLIIIVSAFKLFSHEQANTPVVEYVSALAVSVTALVPVFSVITAAARSIKAGAQFMLSFVPVYGTILVAAGRPLTSAASGGILLAAGEGIVQLATYVIVPLVGSYLAICITGSVSPILKTSGISELLKKTANWSLGLIMTVYIGVLTLQTTVNSAADNMAVRTGRFLLGSFVPVVGGALSEALTTLQSGVSLLRSSVGIYGVVVLVLTVLPVFIELLLWRAAMLLCSSAAGIFGCDGISALLKSADAALSFLISVLLICSFAFIISLAVLCTAGG